MISLRQRAEEFLEKSFLEGCVSGIAVDDLAQLLQQVWEEGVREGVAATAKSVILHADFIREASATSSAAGGER